MMNRFEGKVVIVTGAGSGIGAATAKRFLEEGAAVGVPCMKAISDGCKDGFIAKTLRLWRLDLNQRPRSDGNS